MTSARAWRKRGERGEGGGEGGEELVPFCVDVVLD